MTDPSGHSRLRQKLRPRTRLKAWLGPRLDTPSTPEIPGWPADFFHWIRRRGGRQFGGYPEVWRARREIPFSRPARLGVVLHAFYPEIVDEILEQLRHIPVDFDLLVTNATGTDLELPDQLGRLRNACVLDVENRGRDILPLANLVNARLLDPYHLILKVHTKRSSWRADHVGLHGDGVTWRRELLGALLGSSENVTAILSAFTDDRDLGIVTADGSVLGPEFWGDNEDNVANLMRRLELQLDQSTLRFAAGSMYWARGLALQGLRALNLSAEDFEAEDGQVNATTAHAVERLIGVLAGEAGLSISERSALRLPSSASAVDRFGDADLRCRARIVPFYLPQFHPIEENNRWWGEGFTEWSNVAAAQPVYEGQYQPRLPRDLGFYDLRLDEVRDAQASLSTSFGVAGFMYYHYWFAGRRLLESPIARLVDSDTPQPFCVMWANENWTRRWDGRESDVLIAQDYDRTPAHEFIEDLLPLLADERYMAIDGRKIIAIYRPGQIPDLLEAIAHWRRRAREAGVGELYVMNVDVDVEFDGLAGALANHDLDGSLGFPPHNHLYRWLPHEGLGVDPRFGGNILSYQALVEDAEKRLRSEHRPHLFPGVMVAFDNTPRRQWESDIWYGSNPFTFRRWLARAVDAVADRPGEERIVFINAWNEWAEGAVLEPTDRFGPTYLLAVRDVVYG